MYKRSLYDSRAFTKFIDYLFIVEHCLMVGVAFASFQWWEGIISVVPFVSQVYWFIRTMGTNVFWIGLVNIGVLLLFLHSAIVSAIKGIRENAERIRQKEESNTPPLS